MSRQPVVIWSIRDGKAGHASQISGLVDALAELSPIQEYTFKEKDIPAPFFTWLVKRFPNPDKYPLPDLVIGAGHRTHIPVLAARRSFGGHSIILMNPSLPKWLFDLCIIPEHDNVPAGENIILTQGALSSVCYHSDKDKKKGLILLGGSSRFYQWEDSRILQHLRSILEKEPGIQWTLLTSRRTPSSLCSALTAFPAPVNVFTPQQCPPAHYKSLLEQAGYVWATQDSVSMIYEALTAGSPIGIIPLQIKKTGRPVRAIQQLIASHRVTPYEHWVAGSRLVPPTEALQEAVRCAEIITEKWL